MSVKKQPRAFETNVPPDLHLSQTRKVDSMSELVADMLLQEADADATLPPPPASPSPASFSAVQSVPSARPRPEYVVRDPRPLALDLDEPMPQFRSRTGRAVLIALVAVLGIAGVLAALLLRAS